MNKTQKTQTMCGAHMPTHCVLSVQNSLITTTGGRYSAARISELSALSGEAPGIDPGTAGGGLIFNFLPDHGPVHKPVMASRNPDSLAQDIVS